MDFTKAASLRTSAYGLSVRCHGKYDYSGGQEPAAKPWRRENRLMILSSGALSSGPAALMCRATHHTASEAEAPHRGTSQKEDNMLVACYRVEQGCLGRALNGAERAMRGHGSKREVCSLAF